MIDWSKIYVDSKCPDCHEPIPENTDDGEDCKNCGHVFWQPRMDDDLGTGNPNDTF